MLNGPIFKGFFDFILSPYGLVTPVKIVSKVFNIHITRLVVEASWPSSRTLNGVLPARGRSRHRGQRLLSAGEKLLLVHKLEASE